MMAFRVCGRLAYLGILVRFGSLERGRVTAMRVYDTPSIRNVAIVGHSGSGKTQLTSAMLFDAGMVNRLGMVDEGTTVTDFDEEAIERKHTLAATASYAEWNKTKINVLDTPGIANFLSEARTALGVSDAAVVVVDAVSGVEVQTEKTWAEAQELGIPRVVVLNHLDRERASLTRSLTSLQDVLGRIIVPIQVPIGSEKSFRGVVDLITMRALLFASDSDGKPSVEDIPDDLIASAKTARETLIEMVAEADDNLMEKFFEAGTLSQEELEAGLRIAVLAGQVAPLLCTSATLNIGVVPLLDA
ncbi:MAG TPA: GTP-binding protein, partial [Acidobacteria bacterium]|nr:GTP-binding protein [Acidobacteriota bacterium]